MEGFSAVFCEGLKNIRARWNRGASIDVVVNVTNFLNHGRRFVHSEIIGNEELIMKRLSVVTAMVVGVSLLTSEAMFAAPLAVHTPVHAMFSRDKMVKFNLHNSTDAPIKVKAGDAEMTLMPGKDTPVKLAVGTKVMVAEATPHYAEGSVLTVVSSDLSDATVRLN